MWGIGASQPTSRKCATEDKGCEKQPTKCLRRSQSPICSSTPSALQLNQNNVYGLIAIYGTPVCVSWRPSIGLWVTYDTLPYFDIANSVEKGLGGQLDSGLGGGEGGSKSPPPPPRGSLGLRRNMHREVFACFCLSSPVFGESFVSFGHPTNLEISTGGPQDPFVCNGAFLGASWLAAFAQAGHRQHSKWQPSDVHTPGTLCAHIVPPICHHYVHTT